MFTELSDVFVKDFGVRCECGGFEFQAIFDLPDDMLAMGGGTVQSAHYTLTAKTSDVFAASMVAGTSGSTLVVTQNGVLSSYKVRSITRLDDGVFSHVGLSKI